ncbi:MAG: hypothetical protein QOG36_690, partial [Actinomycetota bacterium]|nr:hypothetical protein [Actinomycetota bacterium]
MVGRPALTPRIWAAGRNLAEAEGVLLVGSEDADIQDYFI